MFLWNGDIVELDATEVIFSDHPADRGRSTTSTGSSDERPRRHGIVTRGLNLWYGAFQALIDVSVDIKGA